MLAKLIRPGDGRKSRLRNARDVPVGVGRIIRNGPRALISAARLKVTGTRPQVPWICYDAIAELDRLLKPEMHVLEFGSGMSTLWFAERVASVISVDDSAEWIAFQEQGIRDRGISNVTLVHAGSKAAYTRPADGPFDFILIDGLYRDTCAKEALSLIKPGGLVYLDNSDVRVFNEQDGNLDDARDLLTDNAWSTKAFVDFVPTILFVSTGHLFQF
jgi:predicted O-methyltransferase YrrM